MLLIIPSFEHQSTPFSRCPVDPQPHAFGLSTPPPNTQAYNIVDVIRSLCRCSYDYLQIK